MNQTTIATIFAMIFSSSASIQLLSTLSIGDYVLMPLPDKNSTRLTTNSHNTNISRVRVYPSKKFDFLGYEFIDAPFIPRGANVVDFRSLAPQNYHTVAALRFVWNINFRSRVHGKNTLYPSNKGQAPGAYCDQ